MNRTGALLSAAVAVGIVMVALSAMAVSYLAHPPRPEVTSPGFPGPSPSVTIEAVAWSGNATTRPVCNATIYLSPPVGFTSAAGIRKTIYATLEYPSGHIPARTGTTLSIYSVTTPTAGFTVTDVYQSAPINATGSSNPTCVALLVTVQLPAYGVVVPTLSVNVTAT